MQYDTIYAEKKIIATKQNCLCRCRLTCECLMLLGPGHLLHQDILPLTSILHVPKSFFLSRMQRKGRLLYYNIISLRVSFPAVYTTHWYNILQ